MKLFILIMSLVGVIAEGDSLTYQGGPSPGAMGYFNNLAGVSAIPGTSISNNDVLRLGYRWKYNGAIFCNCSIGGSKLSAISARFATHVQPLIQKSRGNPPLSAWEDTRPTRKYVLVLMAGTNADTTNPNTHAANIATYIATARAAGFDKVILCPLISRTDGAFLGTPGSTTFDTTLVIPYNAIIVDSTWQSNNGVDAVPRWDQEAHLCLAGAANNITYFDPLDPDNPQNGGVHPSPTGASLMYPYFNTALNALLASL